MEELQDAIEDAQYISAMNDNIPRPTKPWTWPTATEFQVYLDKLMAVNPNAFEADGLCKASLGFYMFMKFCREQSPISKVMAEFIEDVAAFRNKSTGGMGLVEYAIILKDMYLVDGSAGRSNDVNRIRLPGLFRSSAATAAASAAAASSSGAAAAAGASPSAPRVKVFNKPLQIEVISSSVKVVRSCESSEATAREAPPTRIDVDVAKNAIKLIGKPVKEAIEAIEQGGIKREPSAGVIGQGGSEKRRRSGLKMGVFDEIESIVFNHLVDKHFMPVKHSPYWTRYFQYMFTTERKVVEDDFTLFRVLGRGGFGLVNACKRCTTGKLYAMKMLNKRRIKMKKAEALCLNERNILAMVQSPYVVCLKYAFTTATDVYLVLDLMTGGDLGFHLSRKGRFSEKESKYYAARTLLGIAALHEKNIAYRDLKPENILMDEEGYTKISDLGLACKVGKSGLTGTCGTRGYWAPEMLRRDANDKREKYTVTVDWFSFGCLVYEFLYGISPFRTEKARKWGDFPKVEKADRDKAIDLAIQQMEPDFDETIFSPVARDLIEKLLNKDGRRRLGSNGYMEIVSHPWFRSIDWDNISRSQPPLKPARDINMATQSEIGVFADEKESRKIVLTPEDHKTYDQWEFISKRAFQDEVVEFLLFEERLGPIPIEKLSSSCCIVA